MQVFVGIFNVGLEKIYSVRSTVCEALVGSQYIFFRCRKMCTRSVTDTRTDRRTDRGENRDLDL